MHSWRVDIKGVPFKPVKPTEAEPRNLTERNSKKRIALLATANTHGKKFFVTR
jgi:hypothetical protein